MFDRLVESEPAGADFKNRRKYFMVSSVVVGIVFAAAVVVSIFAADYGLGSSSFDLVEILAPHEAAPPKPEDREQHPAAAHSSSESPVPTRQASIARLDQSTTAPDTISTTRNTQMEMPDTGRFRFDKYDSNSGTLGGSGRDSGVSIPGGTGLINSTVAEHINSVENTTPPPVVKPLAPKSPRSLGVINGRATHLPKPVYSATALAAQAQGKVDVQVTIDEDGRVISARAMHGHPMLRGPAEQAARRAKFTTTYLSKVPVKVTGVIVYNFTR